VIIFLERSGGGAIRDSGDRQPQAFLRRLVAVSSAAAAGCSFLLRPPDTGKSKDGWRRSGIVVVRFFSFFALAPFAGVSCAMLRFKADIRSITGGASVSARLPSGLDAPRCSILALPGQLSPVMGWRLRPAITGGGRHQLCLAHLVTAAGAMSP
jgi:hypothetical protein